MKLFYNSFEQQKSSILNIFIKKDIFLEKLTFYSILSILWPIKQWLNKRQLLIVHLERLPSGFKMFTSFQVFYIKERVILSQRILPLTSKEPKPIIHLAQK